MMRAVVVPNSLRDIIYEKVDAALAPHPHLKDRREEIYYRMLDYYDANGTVPEFTIEPAQQAAKKEG